MKVIIDEKNRFCGLGIENILIPEIQQLIESEGIEVSFCAEQMQICLGADNDFYFDSDFRQKVSAICAKQTRPLWEVLLDDFIIVAGLGVMTGSLIACASIILGATILSALQLSLCPVIGAFVAYGFFRATHSFSADRVSFESETDISATPPPPL